MTYRTDTHRPISIDEIEARLRAGSPSTPGHRHYRIGGVPKWELAVMVVVAFLIGMMVGIGGVL